MTATELKWAERVKEWRAGGQPAAEYAQGRGFKESTLRWWASRLDRGATWTPRRRSAAKAKPAAPVRMARVVTSAAASASLMVRVGAIQVELRRGFDHALLRELVEALGGAS
jgi:hypothetical protein